MLPRCVGAFLGLAVHLAATAVVRSEELLMSSTGLTFAGGSYLETVYVCV